MAQQLWDIAKPFGRPRKFKTAEELWDAFVAYTKWNEQNPLTVHNVKKAVAKSAGQDKSALQETVERPYSLVAFRFHAGIKREWSVFKGDYEHRSQDFCKVIDAIERSIRQQQIDNAAVGNYKENLVARLNGISENITQKVKADVKENIQLSPEQAKALLREIEAEI